MKLIVLLAEDHDNPEELPSSWPIKAKEVPDDFTTLSPWIEMTPKEYKEYKLEFMPLYENWVATRQDPRDYVELRKEAYEKINHLTMEALVEAMEIIKISGVDVGIKMTALLDIRDEIKALYPKE